MQLLDDNHFKTGFDLKSTTTLDGSTVVKNLDYNGEAEPKDRQIWQMAQWWTPFNFKDAPYRKSENTHIYENESRLLGVNTEEGSLRMRLDSWKEYENLFCGSRTRPSQNWSHFLIEQTFSKQPRIMDMSSLRLSLDFQIDEITLFDEDHFNPSLHTAQFVLYLTVRNVKKNQFFWFGLTLYDYRGNGNDVTYSIDKGFEGATNSLIYSIGRRDFLNGQLPKVGTPYQIDVDLLPFIQDAIIFGSTNEKIGKPLEGWEMQDTYVNYMNFGWELPGSFRIDSTFENLSLVAEE